MKKIGIFGGTFNPIHNGHLAIAQVSLERLNLDKVLFVPCYLPPHKGNRGIVDAHKRYQMVKLAIKDNPCFDISDFEIRQKGRSYSIKTVKYFKDRFDRRTKFYFLIGGDSLNSLHIWKNINELNTIVTFVSINRKGYKNKNPQYRIRNIETLDLGVSSSYIRREIRKKRSAKYLVPDKVLGYIKRCKLYQ